ncbi:MAG: hypothetical protein Q4E53_13995 [Eubacteriales bacterium]|nr:hypothetical protein [Eubacteriales bacterium]
MKSKKANSYPIARIIRGKIPESLMKSWNRKLETIFQDRTVSRKENSRLLEEFQLKQITLAFYGVLFLIGLIITISIYLYTQSRIVFSRNQFGEGEKEVVLQVEQEGKKKELTLILEEKTLTQKEEDSIFQEFFQQLEGEILGKNSSLQKINHKINLVDEVSGYPFYVTYDLEDSSVLDWNGDLGDKAKVLKNGEVLHTNLVAHASYKQYEREKIIPLTMVAPGKKNISVFQTLKNTLVREEAYSRTKEDFIIESERDHIHISKPSENGLWKYPIFVAIVLILLIARQYSMISEADKVRHKENMEDFPLIVHLLTLYMGAGLSFPAAVSRITEDYIHCQRERKQRYAFEQMMVMNHCMEMGVRPREACLSWGASFREKMYAKFAMLLSQSLSKGAKETRSMMEQEQQEAFQIQVDYVKREGEEASTKLLFPMIILLSIVMILIMFPAMMQFYGL